jgi:hypothetical protein
MNFKIKKILKTTTSIVTIISLIGCSSAPKKEIPVYRQEMDAPLQVGMNYKKFEDDSALTIYVDENKKITSIVKFSKGYDNRDVCLKYLEMETEVLLDKLGPFNEGNQETKNYISNKDYSITKKQCETQIQTTNSTNSYQYTIEVRPISKSAQNNMTGVVDMFKAIGLWLFAVVVVAPIMIVGFIVIGIPFYIYTVATGGKHW